MPVIDIDAHFEPTSEWRVPAAHDTGRVRAT
jgi:hypothetical protein